MKSSAPWSVKGIERDARETAKEAAKRQGMTVGEWLNQVIYTAGEAAPSDGDIEGLKLRDLVTAIEHLHKRLAETDVKNADAIGELTRNIGGAVERLQRLERVKPAEGTYDDLATRLQKLEKAGGDRQRIEALKALEKAVAQVAVQFDSAHKKSLERINATELQIQDLAARIDGLGDAGETPDPGVLREAVDSLTTRISHAEHIASEAAKLKEEAMSAADPEFIERTGERLRILGDEIKRGGDQIRTLEGALGKMSDRIEAAEKRSAEGVQKIAETVSALNERLDTPPSESATQPPAVEEAIMAIRQETDARLSALHTTIQDIAERLSVPRHDAPADTTHETESSVAKNTESEERSQTKSQISSLLSGVGVAAQDEDAGAPHEENERRSPLSESDNLFLSEDEDDPFAFADEDFAASTSPSDGSLKSDKARDDFEFDLDDDVNEEQYAELSGAGFEDTPQKPHSETPQSPIDEPLGDSNKTPAGVDDDLDDILADLDPLTASDNAPPSFDEPTTAKALLTGAKPEMSKDPEGLKKNSDLPGDIEDGGENESSAVKGDAQTRPTRRTLTAKQKAILAARARQKRKAAGAQATSVSPAPASSKPSRHETTSSEIAEKSNSADEDAAAGLSGKMTSAIASIKNRLTGKKAAKKDHHKDKLEAARNSRETGHLKLDETLEDSEENVGRSKMSAMSSASIVGARPVTVALAGAILLALTALFFLVRDVVFKPDAIEPAAPSAATPMSANPTRAETVSSISDNPSATVASLDANIGVISPRNLYVESVAALNAASAPEETSAAIRKLEEAAALGHPPAQLQLGELYKTGQGVDQDFNQAQTWFRRSANGGNVLAMHRIGVLTARGEGGAPNPAEAVTWFEQAANHGLVDSQYNLGAIFHPTGENSSGLQDAGKAYYWYSLAARNGDEQAAPLAAGVANALSAEERQQIDADVASWRAETMDQTANELAAG